MTMLIKDLDQSIFEKINLIFWYAQFMNTIFMQVQSEETKRRFYNLAIEDLEQFTAITAKYLLDLQRVGIDYLQRSD